MCVCVCICVGGLGACVARAGSTRAMPFDPCPSRASHTPLDSLNAPEPPPNPPPQPQVSSGGDLLRRLPLHPEDWLPADCGRAADSPAAAWHMPAPGVWPHGSVLHGLAARGCVRAAAWALDRAPALLRVAASGWGLTPLHLCCMRVGRGGAGRGRGEERRARRVGMARVSCDGMPGKGAGGRLRVVNCRMVRPAATYRYAGVHGRRADGHARRWGGGG